MHRSRRAIAASVSVSMALATSVTVAQADDSSSVLYVNNATTAACSDTASGAGSAATPFCTIQAAANAATPGDTVDISAGTYPSADIKSVGTAQAPIVFQATGGTALIRIENPAGASAGPALSFDGASYVTFEGSEGVGPTNAAHILAYGVVVNGSSHITLDGLRTLGPNDGVEVTGTSSDVAITRSLLAGALGGVVVDAGSSGDVISTNEIETGQLGVSVDGATDTAITSNSLLNASTLNKPIQVIGGATGTSIENNIVVGPGSGTGAAITVDSTSTAGTTDDYNVVWPYGEGSGPRTEWAYSWGGVDYPSQSSFNAATSQGAHDLVADPQFNGWPYTRSFLAPQVNSANAAAPGMLQTDVYGEPCTANPIVAVTGAGSPAYCARGAVQQTYSPRVITIATLTNALSVDLDSSMFETTNEDGSALSVSSTMTPNVSYAVDWGDGTSSTVQGSATNVDTDSSHTYAEAGTYKITDTAELTDGTTTSTTTTVTTAGSDYTALGPKRILDTRNGTGATKAKVAVGHSVTVNVAGVDGIPADATAVALNLTETNATGNGYLSVGDTAISNLNYAAGQTIANSVIAPVVNGSITIYNSGTGGSADMIADVSGYFDQSGGNGFAVTTPARVLDTRNGTGAAKAKVAANSGIPVTIAGADSIPAGVSAVAVHVTVVDTTGNGWIAAEPDGAGTPTTSSLNYGKGQIVSNTVIVPVAADGKIELYNGGGTTSVDLVADVSGYFSSSAVGAYMPITPFRVNGQEANLNPGQSFGEFLDEVPAGSDTSEFPANATMVVNLTTTQETSNGYITDYPDGTTPPNTSALNFGPGQTVANLSIVGSTGAAQIVDFYNHSLGYTGLIVDVQGYFTNS